MLNRQQKVCSLIHPYQNVQKDLIENCLNKNFFDHVKKPDKNQQIEVLKQFQKFQDQRSRGYGKLGLENMINNLSNKDTEIVKISLEMLDDELKNSYTRCLALKLGISDKIFRLIRQNADNQDTKIPFLSLIILNLISKDFKESQKISQDQFRIKSIFSCIKCQFDMSIEVLQTLSENPYALQSLLKSKYFIDELHKLIHIKSSQKFFSVLSNFIAAQPELFADIEILKSLTNNISKSNALKCLALILNCDDCQQHAIELKIENILFDILATTCDDKVKAYAIMAMRSYLTFGNVAHNDFPWKQLLGILIEGASTKTNELLQESCVQALRIVSDVTVVKDYLRKSCITQLKNISPMTLNAKIMKQDLLEWLSYRNYKSKNDCEKYSKLFI